MSTGPSLDERMMDLALAEARKGRTAPNPHVGALVAIGEEVVGLGHHERAGHPHAEPNAIAAAGARAAGGTLYCTLEPCNHHGRTGPCTDMIVRAGIRRVVVGCRDPKRHGPEAGVERLAALGIETVIGVREAEARELIADFATLALHGRPLTVLKGAMTLDGKIATRTGDSKWITSEASRAEGHALRAECDAVMVGVDTVLADDPQLDVRLVSGRDPIRIILDTHLRTPATARIVAHESPSPTWILHGPSADGERRRALARDGDVVLIESALAQDGRIDLAAALAELGRRDLMRLLVEGGSRVHGALVEQQLADRAVVFLAPLVLGDRAARSLVEVHDPPDTIARATRLERTRVRAIGDELRIDMKFASAPF
jgi:diaminohydroxyphosphoribosylaminopyrimidine deaminase / 5-amino-6-(5-phosphoribosylamino)uracil reductase